MHIDELLQHENNLFHLQVSAS